MMEPAAPPRRPPLKLLLGAVALLVAVMVLLPDSGTGPRSSDPDVTINPRGLAERPPFGRPLSGALAYLADNRTFNLVDLGTGRVLGSKGVPGNRRAAAASNTAAFLGNLPQGSEDDGNWDRFRSVPWNGTEARDHGEGLDIVYSAPLNVVARAMRPISRDEGNGVRFTGEIGAWTAASSSGFWSFPVWVGEQLLVRELVGSETNWWLLDGRDREPPTSIDLPAAFLPIAGTTGLVMGELDGDGVIIELATGRTSRLSGRYSWAADWRPQGDPLLATVGGQDPASLVAYTPTGLFAWSVPLREPVTRFGGGVSWAPDGSFVIVHSRGTLEAYTAQGGTIGTFDTGLPSPEQDMNSGFVTVVHHPVG